MLYAAYKGRVAAIETLVRLGSKAIDTPNNNGWTPLYAAAFNGHVPAIETLVRLGSKAIDAPDNKGCTPIHSAARNGQAKAIEVLVLLGSKAIDSPNKQGETPAAIAMKNKDNGVLHSLLESGADLSKALLPSNFLALTSDCLDFGFPALQLAPFFNPKRKHLVFNHLSDFKAARLPLKNWRGCSLLDFRGCSLSEIPLSLGELDPDQYPKIMFDPRSVWSSPYEEKIINSNDPRTLIQHARMKANGESLIRINECKLIAVGFAAVGKTTLIRRLKQQSYAHPVSTDGVDMGELVLPTKTGESMRVVVWDFAGQPLYRQTHLLFLRNPGICLLMFKLTDDVKTSVEQLRYWCTMLRSFNVSSTQVLLVGTHLDRCDPSEAARHAFEVQQSLQDFLHIPEPPLLVSCADGGENERTIRRVREAILRIAVATNIQAPACIEIVRKALLPLANSSVPLFSSAILHDIISETATEANHHRLRSDFQLREACLRALQALGLLTFIERRGKVTHIIANPQWIALLLATVVTTRHTWVARGRLAFGTLSNQIWQNNQRFPVEIHQILVELLQQLKIMFPLEKGHRGALLLPSTLYFIPCTLPEQRPSWSGSQSLLDSAVASHNHSPYSPQTTLHRVFKLKEVDGTISIGVMPEMIAQTMALPGISLLEIWQQGAVFRIKSLSSSCALILAITRSAADSITVALHSTEVQQAAKWIRKVSTMVENQLLDVCHLEFEVRVPCPEDDECYLLLDDLRSSIIEQRSEVACHPTGRHQTPVSVLAPDILFEDLASQSLIHQWRSIKLIEQLGSGAFGKVMLGSLVQSSTPAQVAVKLLQRKDDDESTDLNNFREFQHEAYLMSTLTHPNVVRFVGVCFPSNEPGEEYESSPSLLMEVIGGGTLYDSLVDTVGIQKLCKLATELLDAIGSFNTNKAKHKANSSKFPEPAPMPPLFALCDSALGNINQIFAERIFKFKADLEAEHLRSLAKYQQQLTAQLQACYNGPWTSELNTETDRLLDDILKLAPATNELVPIGWPLRLKLATDLAQGLAYMHSLSPPVVHRDFKSPNVFLTRRLDTIDLTGIDWNQPLAKVGDFGLSISMLGTHELNANGKDGQGLSNINPTWAAPEILSGQCYSTEADVYAMGIALWELLLRQHPFFAIPMTSLANHVKSGHRPSFATVQLDNSEVAQDYIDLAKQCWSHDPDHRPTIDEVYSRLRELSRRAAPEIFSTLPDRSSPIIDVPAPDFIKQTVRNVPFGISEIKKLPINYHREGAKMMCLQAVGGYSCWLGMSTGSVGAQLFVDQTRTTSIFTCCIENDRHAQSVSAMCYNPTQQTVWSCATDGSIIVWSNAIENREDGRARCFLKNTFILVSSNVRRLSKHREKALSCVLRNGMLHFYPDEHVGPSVFELDVMNTALSLSSHMDGSFEIVAENTSRIKLRSAADETGSEPSSLSWIRTISYLSDLAANERGLPRLAASSCRSGEYITALEAVDDTTWAVSLAALTEWKLVAAHHGLHNQLHLEPGRQLQFEMGHGVFAEPRLRSVCGLIRVAPNVLWIGAANTILSVDLSAASDTRLTRSSSSELSVWPPPAGMASHKEAIRLVSLVESPVSASGYEVWAYAQFEDILIFQTPLAELDGEIFPVLLDPVPLEKGAPLLTCMKQVGNQVWAGTRHGTVVGWDIATRQPLVESPLQTDLRHSHPETNATRPTTAIVEHRDKKRRVVMAISAGQELTLRQFNLQEEWMRWKAGTSPMFGSVRLRRRNTERK